MQSGCCSTGLELGDAGGSLYSDYLITYNGVSTQMTDIVIACLFVCVCYSSTPPRPGYLDIHKDGTL